jgi:hypothetical protein
MPIVDHTARITGQLTQLVACLNQAIQLTEEIIDTSKNHASSAEFVGEFWLGEGAQCVI